MIARILTWLRGPRCAACGDRVHDDRLSLHWYANHAGELQ